jgi:tRNA A22 N-methylase
MGGSEIVSILSDGKHGFMPKRFVFQPMHDAEKLRCYIVENGGYIERDFTFADGKFYEVITGGRNVDGRKNDQGYTAAEYEFGRENLRDLGEAFVARTEKLIKNIGTYLQDSALQAESRAQLESKRERLKGVLSGEVK